MEQDNIERIPTGIEGLDELIEGGFPRGSSILVTGTPGTAKTTFGLQFLVNGTLNYNEGGVYFGPGAYVKELSSQLRRYGYDLNRLQQEGKILVVSPKTKVEEGEDILQVLFDEKLKRKLVEMNAKRMVIDSLTIMIMFGKEYGGKRRMVEGIVEYLKDMGITTVLTHERSVGGKDEIEYGVEEFIVDGIVYLQMIRMGNLFRRAVTILKMRGTKHSMDIHPFLLESNGVRVYPREKIFQ